MGNGAHSKIKSVVSSAPERPFDPDPVHSCIKRALLFSSTTPTRCVLQRLLLLHDWQRVLVRCKMFPGEINKPFQMELYSMNLIMFPLHLAVGLNAPKEVVQILITNHNASNIPLELANGKLPQRHAFRLRQYMRRNKSQLFPVFKSDASRVLDRKKQSHGKNSGFEGPFLHSMASPTIDCEAAASSSQLHSPMTNCITTTFSIDSTSSCRSHEEHREEPRVILQLGDCGQITTFRLDEEVNSTEDGPDAKKAMSCHNLRDLHLPASEISFFLPIHIACIFGASTEVLELLLTANPSGAFSFAAGMLPIHMVSAGWKLPMVSESSLESHIQTLFPTQCDNHLLDVMVLLRDTAPETLEICSRAHGLKAIDYVEECMADCEPKVKQELLQVCCTYRSGPTAELCHKCSFASVKSDESFSSISDCCSLDLEELYPRGLDNLVELRQCGEEVMEEPQS